MEIKGRRAASVASTEKSMNYAENCGGSEVSQTVATPLRRFPHRTHLTLLTVFQTSQLSQLSQLSQSR
jgi:hypothetical protein